MKLAVALIVRKLPLMKNLRLNLLIVVSTEIVPKMRFILENFPSPKGAVYGAAARAAVRRSLRGCFFVKYLKRAGNQRNRLDRMLYHPA